MEYMGKKLEDIVVTLPFADGTTLECGVFAHFTLGEKDYFALLPLIGKKQLDMSASYMLYQVEKDEEDNPVVLYIEDDREYEIVAAFFSAKYLK